MFKLHLLLEAPSDPFANRGEEAATAVRELAPEVLGYTQSRASLQQLSDAPVFAGAAELWFATEVAALWAASALKTCSLWAEGVKVAGVVVGHERTVLRTAAFRHGAGIKGVFPFNRRSDLGVREFQAYWWHHHGPIAALTEQATAYLQCHPLTVAYEQKVASFDGVTELFWTDFEAASAAMSSRQMTEDQAGDSKNFVDGDSVRLFFAEEEVVIAP